MKSILVMVSIFLVFNSGFADEKNYHKKDRMVGFKIGKNFTTWLTNQNDQQNNFNMSFDYSFNIFVNNRLSNQFFYGYEFIVSLKKFNIKNPSAKESMICFQLPLLLGYIIEENQNMSLKFYKGLGLGFNKRFMLQGSSSMKGPVLDLILGLTFQFKSLVFDVRYDYSISDTYDIDLEPTIKGKWSTFSIMVGVEL